MKKAITFICSFALVISICATALASTPIRVIVDGELLYAQAAPFNDGGTILVPMRVIFEKLGLQVGWNSETRTATGTGNGASISLTIDKTEAFLNGTPVNLPKAPRIINGNTMLPLRFVAESTGAEVNWNNNTQIATIIGDGVDKLDLPLIIIVKVDDPQEDNQPDGQKNLFPGQTERDVLNRIATKINYVEVINPVTGQTMPYDQYERLSNKDDPFGWRQQEKDRRDREFLDNEMRKRMLPDSEGMISGQKLKDNYHLFIYWALPDKIEFYRDGQLLYTMRNIPTPLPTSKVKIDGIGIRVDPSKGEMYDYNDLIEKGIIEPFE